MSRFRWLSTALAGSAALGAAVLLSNLGAAPELKSRSFEFTYAATLKPPADAAKVEVWIPVPQPGPGQSILDLKIDAPFPYTIEKETEYGSAILHGILGKPTAPVCVTLKATVVRTELKRDLAALTGKPDPKEDLTPFARLLQPDRLGIINDEVKARTAAATAGKSSTLEKARAIYDNVFDTMAYNKEGTGWGKGDVVFACNEKRGNCSDFHSLFISMARAAGIPARFEIGFSLPTDKKEGTLGGYHCWAQFYLPGAGWVPVDCSEARKHPELKEYYFGCLCENRVLFSAGRDLTLTPVQAGGPVNFLIYPYVEVDGKPSEAFEKTFSFKDLSGAVK